jgi:hypothetical protein
LGFVIWDLNNFILEQEKRFINPSFENTVWGTTPGGYHEFEQGSLSNNGNSSIHCHDVWRPTRRCG